MICIRKGLGACFSVASRAALFAGLKIPGGWACKGTGAALLQGTPCSGKSSAREWGPGEGELTYLLARPRIPANRLWLPPSHSALSLRPALTYQSCCPSLPVFLPFTETQSGR